MEPQKLFKLTAEDRATKQAEVCEMMHRIHQLDLDRARLKAEHKEAIADIDALREPMQVRVLALLEDLGAT